MLKKTPILLLCLAAISFFLYKVIANTKTNSHEISTQEPKEKEGGSTLDSINANPKLSNRVLKIIPQKETYYDRLATMMDTKITNDENLRIRLCTNPNLKNLFKTANPVFGFYGEDRYKIDYYIASTKVDPSKPFRILITGQTKYKKNIRDIQGYFDVEAVAINTNDSGGAQLNINYCVKGKFHFDETNEAKPVGFYDGEWIADVSEIENEIHELEFGIPDKPFALGNELLLSGHWQNGTKEISKPLCFSQNIIAVGADIFKAFTYGERDVSLNEAFASKGWNDYYENNEWWNKSN